MTAMESRRHASGGMSRGLRIALILTVILTLLSFGVRKWRQANAGLTPIEAATSENAGRPKAATSAQQPSGAPVGLRSETPAASLNPMARRNAPATPPPEGAKEARPPEPPPPPPQPKLEPPSFRLIGLHVDGKGRTVFFAQADKVIAAKPGTSLPDGFVLKSINKDGVTVVRRSNREKIEMPLETPK